MVFMVNGEPKGDIRPAPIRGPKPKPTPIH